MRSIPKRLKTSLVFACRSYDQFPASYRRFEGRLAHSFTRLNSTTQQGIHRIASFTLVEMLVALAVMSLLFVLLFSLTNSALQVTDSSERKSDIGIEANQVLDRIGMDIAGMVSRPDVDQFYYQVGQNDKMFFYSHQTGYFDSTVPAVAQSSDSLIGYRVSLRSDNGGQPTLERLGQGLTWNGASAMQFLVFPPLPPTSSTSAANAIAGMITNQWSTAVGVTGDGTSPYYDPIGTQVFRLGICFQLQNGSYSTVPGYTNSAPSYPGKLSNTVAIVVAIALLDSKSRKLVSDSSWTKLTTTAFPAPTQANLISNPPILIDSQWNSTLLAPAFTANAGIPALVKANIRIYQRSYRLNMPSF